MKTRFTPKELNRSDDNALNEWLATSTDPREIQELLGIESSNCNGTLFERSKAAINILVAEQQAKSAQKLERQTQQLIYLTWALAGLTAVLLLVTIVTYQDSRAAAKSEKASQHDATEQH